MDQTTTTWIAVAVPTLAVIAGFIRNEAAFSSLAARVETMNRDVNARFEMVDARFETLTRDMNARFETLTRRVDAVDRDLREWARIVMRHDTDIARLKDKAGLRDAES
jgi:hypothetical protein